MKKLTQFEFEKRLNGILPDIEVLGNYTNKRTRILVKCKKCGNVWNPIADSLLQGHGCSVCACNGRAGKSKPIIIKGVNDLFTTMPSYAKHLKNKDDAFKYTYGSSKKVMWVCPLCHADVESRIVQVYNRGILCPFCGDGFSYPNKFMYNFLKQLDIKFTREVRIDKYLYDVLIDNTNIIVEMDGGFHFIDNNMTGESKNDVHKRDMLKSKIAKQNGYNLIRIDARKSDIDYLKEAICSSEIITLLNLSDKLQEIDWEYVAKVSEKSLFFDVINLYNKGITSCNEIIKHLPFNLHNSTVYTYLKRGTELGLCSYIPKMNKRKVHCIQEDICFESIKQAQDYYGFSSNAGICNSCKKGTSCYVYKDNKRIKINFEYVD